MLAVLMFGHYSGSHMHLVFGTPPDTDGRSEMLLGYEQNLNARMRTVHFLARQQQQGASSYQQQAYDTQCQEEPIYVFWELGVEVFLTPTQGTLLQILEWQRGGSV